MRRHHCGSYDNNIAVSNFRVAATMVAERQKNVRRLIIMSAVRDKSALPSVLCTTCQSDGSIFGK